VLTVPYEIIKHEAGIRPTVNDRRPILGIHPEHPRLAVFNGLGTKGVMLAPYFANQLIDHLEKEQTIDPEVDLSRFS
jgi:glycine/D-amino acid oxidase-like deaminating enzyme